MASLPRPPVDFCSPLRAIVPATAIAFLVLLADRKENLNNLLDPRIGDDSNKTLQNLFSMANILTVVTDVLISIVMIVLLQKSKTGFRRSTDVINRLMIFTLSTGLPTMLTALACEILIKTSPETPFFLIFIVTLGRWYTNCLLVNLNARDYINGMADMPSMGLELIPLATLNCCPSEERRRPYNASLVAARNSFALYAASLASASIAAVPIHQILSSHPFFLPSPVWSHETFQINIETRTDIAYDHPDPCIQTPAIVFDPEGKSGLNMSF
ncbi:hypothetical protein FISHEDRAFT_76265 [Fistulina hepatica ATCC 64428]|uniref:DUF6534 domain-containing protein n=1 Tax=Fistulina hepatica ATCC 64428 TaxID=1128425 RepID=A0A0D7A3V5_9AGAR|nr:hypothetical protein FISHEDRAFT_76265 [Fistulina hepatica ATCC 64428]